MPSCHIYSMLSGHHTIEVWAVLCVAVYTHYGRRELANPITRKYIFRVNSCEGRKAQSIVPWSFVSTVQYCLLVHLFWTFIYACVCRWGVNKSLSINGKFYSKKLSVFFCVFLGLFRIALFFTLLHYSFYKNHHILLYNNRIKHLYFQFFFILYLAFLFSDPIVTDIQNIQLFVACKLLEGMCYDE